MCESHGHRGAEVRPGGGIGKRSRRGASVLGRRAIEAPEMQSPGKAVEEITRAVAEKPKGVPATVIQNETSGAAANAIVISRPATKPASKSPSAPVVPVEPAGPKPLGEPVYADVDVPEFLEGRAVDLYKYLAAIHFEDGGNYPKAKRIEVGRQVDRMIGTSFFDDQDLERLENDTRRLNALLARQYERVVVELKSKTELVPGFMKSADARSSKGGRKAKKGRRRR